MPRVPAVRTLCLLLGLLAVVGVRRAAAETADAGLGALLTRARAEAVSGCESPADRLVAILCAGQIVIGVRDGYPLFAVGPVEAPAGFEPDIGRAIAVRLGVHPVFRRVSAATRIAALADGQIDMVIATMGHTTQRDAEARFIRPHYYRSSTVLVGRSSLHIDDWNDLAGATVCVTVGSSSNAGVAGHGARLMLFDRPRELTEALALGTCSLAAQDDSYFAVPLAEPGFGARFGIKFSFAPLPWGMAVARDGAARLAAVLDLLSVQFHRDGVFLDLAGRHGVPVGFLQEQQRIWRDAACLGADGGPAPSCFADAVDSALPATRFAGDADAVEHWLAAHLGMRVSLPMLKTMPAWSLFLDGLLNSLMLVSGALVTTFVLTLLIGAALSSGRAVLRLPVRALTLLGQSAPIVLLMFFGYFVASALVTYSVQVAMLAAILVIGLYNASYAGPAVAEASFVLRSRLGWRPPLLQAVRQADAQVLAFLVNAAKGSSIASVIGVPELLDSLTDIASFSSERVTTFTVLLLFYSAVVGVVVWGGEAVRRRLDARGAAA